MLASVAAGGAGAIFVWSTMNDVFQGTSSPLRTLLAVLVLGGMVALFSWVIRYISRLEEPE